jgi:deazaflavin-dependent oxidoreductase (nitroreductase family)
MQPIPKVDPNQKKNRVLRKAEAFVPTKTGTALYKTVIRHVEPLLIRASGGKLQIGPGARVNVTVIGRKSGQPRTATLLYFTQGDDVILIASNFGGEGHPAWYLNLRDAGEAELEWRGGSGKYSAREAEEPERSKLYELAKRYYSGYGDYEARTAGLRTIPVMVLTPAT